MKSVFNPGYQRLYQCIQQRAIHPEQPLPPPPEKLFGQMQPLPDLFDSEKNAALHKLRDLFELKKGLQIKFLLFMFFSCAENKRETRFHRSW